MLDRYGNIGMEMKHGLKVWTMPLVRLMVGGVFVSEGLQKFITPDSVGAGRFVRIGIPWPETVAAVVGTTEVCCGALILLGCGARYAAMPVAVIMLAALGLTKLPLLGTNGVWSFLHESRTDVAMLLGSIILMLNGSGPYSVDARRSTLR